MIKYHIILTDQFLRDVEEFAVWIFLSNIDQSEQLAEKKVDEFKSDLLVLQDRIQDFPELGEIDTVAGIRRFPVYSGRYSVKWIVNHIKREIVLISISDSKYPKDLRHFHFDI